MAFRRFVSWLFILGGLYLLATGARDYFDSELSQEELAADWPEAQPQSPERAPLPPVRKVRGETVARLEIPRLGASWYVLEGSDKRTLRRGPGRLEFGAMPGEEGNFIVAGHRDTHFRALKDIQRGDQIVVEDERGRYLYVVSGIDIVNPRNTKSLRPTPTGTMHLITCYPFYYLGNAPKRFIVKADLIGSDVNAQQASKQKTTS